MDTASFLKTVVTTKEGYFNLAFKSSDDTEWTNEWYVWPDDLSKIVDRALSAAPTENVYFSAHLFEARQAIKNNVLPSRTIQADLDNAIVPVTNAPSVLVETSPNRHQGFWILKDAQEPTTLEALSKQLTYSILDSDHSGWSLGHKMRVAGTFNHKYNGAPKEVKVISAVLSEYANLKLGPNARKLLEQLKEEDENWIPAKLDTGPRELWLNVKSSLPRKVIAQYEIRQQDRSLALFTLECSLFRAGLNRDQVFAVAQASANNKFKDNRYHADVDLAKHVLSAERAVNTGTDEVEDIRSKVMDARRLPGVASEKRAYIAAIVRDYMAQHGSFVATQEGQEWYVRDDTGRPIPLTHRNDYLGSLLEIKFGLNATEPEQRYAVNFLMTTTKERGRPGIVAQLCYYDKIQNIVLLHTGRKDVLRIDPTTLSSIANGNLNIVFPWRNNEEPFDPDVDNPISIDMLFQGCFDNLNEMAPEEALALIKAWFYFLFFRNDATGRPILALFGQPGCISENTLITYKRNNDKYTLSIKDLFYRFNYKWSKKGFSTKIQSLKDGIISYRNIKSIIKSGKKSTYSVVVGNNLPIRVTMDHRFLTPNGYKKLEDLKVGSIVIVKGDSVSSNGRNSIVRKRVQARYHPFAWQESTNGYEYGRIYYYRAVFEARLNNLSTEEFIRIINSSSEEVSKLILLPKYAVFHHRDENPSNNEFANLQVLIKPEHDTEHGFSNVKNFGVYSGLYVSDTNTINSIELYGEEETYDIEMEDETAPNFLVNNVVLHNSGKSTLFRRIYTLLYGPSKAVNSVTVAEDFDHAVSNDPLVVFDNVDTWVSWLPDKLALSASTSDLIKRKLYTDVDTITLKRQALVGLTAHNPKFRREDIVDRLLILSFHRLKEFKPETEILNQIYVNRDKLWGSIVKDIQKILSLEQPHEEDLPRFRVSDFARLGVWISRALGFEKDFRAALASNIKEQTTFNLEEEDILVETIKKWVVRPNHDRDKYWTTGELWTQWSTFSRDPQNFVKLYRNAPTLGKKLWTLQETLTSVVKLQYEFDSTGQRTWRFSNK